MAKRGPKSGGKGPVTMSADTRELERVARELPRELAAETDDALRKLGGQVVDAARRKVRQGPGRHGGRSNSREQAARGIDYKVRDGRLLLTSDSSKMDGGRKAFPAAYSKASWTHPVFGRRDRVSQRGEPGYFDPARSESEARKLLTDAGERACRGAEK